MTQTLLEPQPAPAILAHGRRQPLASGLSMIREGNWLVLESAIGSHPPTMGGPGLWKTIDQRTPLSLFEIPLNALGPGAAGASLGTEDQASLAACIAWAEETDAGAPPPAWAAPSDGELGDCFPAGALTVQAGELAIQGQLVHTANRLAVVFPVLPALSPALTLPRRLWLEELLAETQNRWRMVRTGIVSADGSPAAHAEVDLTGAPLTLLEPLARVAVDALQHAVRWILPAASLINAGTPSRILDSTPVRP